MRPHRKRSSLTLPTLPTLLTLKKLPSFFPISLQGILILVWELVKGMDVLDYMNSLGGVMPEETARLYFKQLLDGIRCIHAHGFCHRDIKPENAIVETETGILKIIDFGLSKHLDSARTVGIGTPDYMAPEILGRSATPGGGARCGAFPPNTFRPLTDCPYLSCEGTITTRRAHSLYPVP